MPPRVELHHVAGHLIDDPDVVLRIDADLLGEHEAVACLSDLANEFSGSIELEQARSTVRERPRAAERHGRMAGSRVHEDIALGVRRHATDFPQVDVIGERQRTCGGIERDLRYRTLGC